MAMNPMQRRARNSFLIGFLVALIIMALVVLFLLNKIKTINENLEALEAKQQSYLVASKDLKSGSILNFDEDFRLETVQTTVPRDTVISEDDWRFTDSQGNFEERYVMDETNKKAKPVSKDIMLKVDVPEGTIVTKDMIVESDEQVKDSDRIVEYNMFVLPSTLKNGDYIDIRFLLPSGKDYVVLPKKRVLGCNETTIWLRVAEEEILLLNNAIVEAYTISGSKLYASLYVEAGMQAQAQVTYLASSDVIKLISKDPNIIQTAAQDLVNRWTQNMSDRVDNFDNLLTPYLDTRDSLVASGTSQEVSSIKAARQNYVKALEGTEDVGYDR